MITEFRRFALHKASGLFFAATVLCIHPTATFAQSDSTSTICKFEIGPRAGEIHDFAPFAPLPIGSPCQFGGTPLSTGHVTNTGATNKANNSVGTICKFETGPMAGKTHDYAPLAPLPVGSPCQDGGAPLNAGHVVMASEETNKPNRST